MIIIFSRWFFKQFRFFGGLAQAVLQEMCLSFLQDDLGKSTFLATVYSTIKDNLVHWKTISMLCFCQKWKISSVSTCYYLSIFDFLCAFSELRKSGYDVTGINWNRDLLRKWGKICPAVARALPKCLGLFRSKFSINEKSTKKANFWRYSINKDTFHRTKDRNGSHITTWFRSGGWSWSCKYEHRPKMQRPEDGS